MNTIEKLKEKGIRPTSQRITIYEFLLGTNKHPSADAVYAALKSKMPVSNLATVYNSLTLFVDKGLIKELQFGKGNKSHFDACIEPHHHFIDDEDGEIIDLPFDQAKVIFNLPAEFEVNSVEVCFSGKRRKPE